MDSDRMARVEQRGPVEVTKSDLPRPFDPYIDNEDWYTDERQIADWAESAEARFEEAVSALSLVAVRVGITQAERVANEHRRRATQADELAQRLRNAARDASEHGMPVAMGRAG